MQLDLGTIPKMYRRIVGTSRFCKKYQIVKQKSSGIGSQIWGWYQMNRQGWGQLSVQLPVRETVKQWEHIKHRLLLFIYVSIFLLIYLIMYSIFCLIWFFWLNYHSETNKKWKFTPFCANFHFFENCITNVSPTNAKSNKIYNFLNFENRRIFMTIFCNSISYCVLAILVSNLLKWFWFIFEFGVQGSWHKDKYFFSFLIPKIGLFITQNSSKHF